MALIAGFLSLWSVEVLFIAPSAHWFVFTDWPVRLTTCSIELTACWCRDWWYTSRCAAYCKRTDTTFCFMTAAFRTINLWIHFRTSTKFSKSTCALLALVFIKWHFFSCIKYQKNQCFSVSCFMLKINQFLVLCSIVAEIAWDFFELTDKRHINENIICWNRNNPS